MKSSFKLSNDGLHVYNFSRVKFLEAKKKKKEGVSNKHTAGSAVVWQNKIHTGTAYDLFLKNGKLKTFQLLVI